MALDVNDSIDVFISCLTDIQQQGVLGLPEPERTRFAFHIIQAKQALCRAGSILERDSFKYRRLIQRYDDYVAKLMKNNPPPKDGA